jgi:uncharacterized protein YndB with AHSA1/START domain
MSTIEVRGVIHAPVAAAWEYLGDFGAVDQWNPFVEHLDVEGVGVGMVRVITTQNGATIHETLEMIDPAEHLLRYAVAPPDGEPSTVSIRLTEDTAGQTTVIWQSMREGDVSDETRETVTAALRSRIDALATVLARQ